MKTNDEQLRSRAAALHLNGVVAHWPEVATSDWVPKLLEWEEEERTRRSLERRMKDARIGRFKSLADFDWAWPVRCDRGAIEGLMQLEFIAEAANVVLVGPNGVGKSTLVKNVAHQALIRGHTVRFTTAGELLGDLAAAGQRYGVAPALAPLRGARRAGHRRNRLPVLFEPPRGFAVRAGEPAL